MVKKLGYKTPTIIALTLAGSALTAHEAHAAEQTKAQETPTNILDEHQQVQQANQAKNETKTPTISGTQAYKDPNQVEIEKPTQPKADSSLLEQPSASSSATQQATEQEATSQNGHAQADVAEQPVASPYTAEEIDPHHEAEVSTEAYHAAQDQKTDAQQETPQDVTKSQQSPSDALPKNDSQNVTVRQQSNQASTEQPTTHTQQPTNNTQPTAKTVQSNTTAFSAQERTTATSNQEKNLARVVARSAEKTPTVKQQSTPTNEKVDINANPNGPTPPRVGGKGGPATVKLEPTNYSVRSVATTPKAYQPQVKSQINNYIRKQKFTVPKYEEDYSSFIPRYGYRYGVGRPEGIVVHDTANDNSTITSEIQYMKNNYQNAFVHGFIDGNRIIETQPTDYLAWGAGPIANQRFIHIELVHVHDYNSFARQMNNFADYAATNLQYYGLKPDSAEYDGKGTVWTHDAVSRYLGGTDHVDPHGYLRAHGYSYDELYDLINEKYQVKMGYASPAGSTSGQTSKPKPQNNNLKVTDNTGYSRISSKNNGLYKTVYDQSGVRTNQTNVTLKVTKKATLNGQSFYLVSTSKNNGLLGWVRSNDVTYQSAQPEKNVKQSYQVKPGTTVYEVPWGTKAQATGTISGIKNQTFKATKEQKVANTNWLYGTVNNLTGWIDASNVVKTPSSSTTAPSSPLKVTSDSGFGRINHKNNGLYKTVYDAKGQPTSATNQTLSVQKKATLNGKSFYLVSDYATGTYVGWVQQKDVDYRAGQVAKNVKQNYTIKPGATLYKVPWGTSAQVAGKVAGKSAQNFAATKSQKVGNLTFVYGTVNQLSGWIDQSLLTQPQEKAVKKATQSVSQIGQLKSSTEGIRASIYDKTAKNAAQFTDRTYKIAKTASNQNRNYVLLQNADGRTPLGWFNANDVILRSLGAEKPMHGQYKVNDKTAGLYSIPWGTAKQRIDALSSTVKNRTFSAVKSVVAGPDTYLFGQVNHKMGWINLKDLKPVASAYTVKSTSATKATKLSQPQDYFVYNGNGYYYAKPNAKVLGSLNAYYETLFKVTSTQKVNGVTWLYGTFENGTQGWIKSGDLRSLLVKYYNANASLKEAVNKQMALSYKPQVQHVPGKWEDANRQEVQAAMDTQNIKNSASGIYQFLKLDQYQGLSADALNRLLAGKGILAGQGAAFAEAAKANNINEIYLISHAFLETGNGTSKLANGGYVDKNNKVITNGPKKYYNMFGIGAVDTDAIRGGFKTAEKYGWDTVKKAIVGGAKFIGQNYIHAGQNTLYRMRWNPQNPATHQYATDIAWADFNAKRMKQFYDQIGEVGKYFDIDLYRQSK